MGYDIDRRTKLARQLKAARQRAALSAKVAAEKLTSLGVNCTRGTLLAWERGGGRTSREPFASDLHLLAITYSCSVNDFFAESSADEAAALASAQDLAGAQDLPGAARNSHGANDQPR